MVYLIAAVAAFVALLILKSRLGKVGKLVVAVIGLVIIVGMLRLDAKFWGVVLMGLSVVILAGMPWLDQSPVKSMRYRPSWHKYIYMLFGVAFVALGYLGVEPPTALGNAISQIGAFVYFGFFFLMPWWSGMGQFKPVPDRVTYHPH